MPGGGWPRAARPRGTSSAQGLGRSARALGLTGPVALRGEPVPGRRVGVVFVNPELAPSAAVPALAWLALDIETDRAGAVTAVSLAGAGGPGEVLFVGPPVASPTVTSVPTERALLTVLGERLRARDPDVVTGWNVVDFDLQVLAARHVAHGIPFDVGRVPGGLALRSRPGDRGAPSSCLGAPSSTPCGWCALRGGGSTTSRSTASHRPSWVRARPSRRAVRRSSGSWSACGATSRPASAGTASATPSCGDTVKSCGWRIEMAPFRKLTYLGRSRPTFCMNASDTESFNRSRLNSL
jgi:hypothetical protein